MNNENTRTDQNQVRSPWGNLTYPRKFTLVALIFALSLLAFLPLILEQGDRIENYGRKEAQGADYLRFLWKLTTDLQSLHIASIELETGTGSASNLNNAQTTVEADIIALDSFDQQYGTYLGTTFEIQEIKSKWAVLRSAIQNKNSTDIEDGFSGLSDSINSLVTEIGDKSYLILDPDLDTYYVMDTVLLNMPENKALTFQIWQIANEAATSKTLTPEKQFELTALISRLKSNLNRLNQNLQTSIANNKNESIKPLILQPSESYLAATQSFINLINTYMSTSQTTQLSNVVLKASYTGVLNSSENLYTASSDALSGGVQTRIQSLSLKLIFAITLALLSTLIAYIIGSRIMRTISLPLLGLLNATQKLTEGDMHVRIPSSGNDEVGQVALAFNTLAEELENNRVTLQTRANELERRSRELEIIAEVGRDIAIIHDLDTMLNVASSLIRERFNFYHTAIFLVDERGEFAIIRSASGRWAQELLNQDHKFRIGAPGVVGGVTQTSQAQIAEFPENTDPFAKDVQLSETRSEIGLPLRGKSLTIGVLDIHSTNEHAFTQRELQIFQILADQLAAAIDNAQLVRQIEEANNQLNLVVHSQTKQNWDNTLLYQNLAYEYDGFHIQAIPKSLPTHLINQLEDGKPVILRQEDINNNDSKPTQSTLLVPLVLSGQVIGVVGLEREKSEIDWTSEDISIAQAAANRAAITLENARLLEESQRRASKEQTISEATSKISTALNVENILNITVEELERILGSSEVILQFNPEASSSSKEQGI